MTGTILTRAALSTMEGAALPSLAVRSANRDVMDDERASFSMEFSHFEQKR
jgi:hypothetical protein